MPDMKASRFADDILYATEMMDGSVHPFFLRSILVWGGDLKPARPYATPRSATLSLILKPQTKNSMYINRYIHEYMHTHTGNAKIPAWPYVFYTGGILVSQHTRVMPDF